MSRKVNGKRQVAPLEHVVHPEGHVAQGKRKEASGTVGARSVSEGHAVQGKRKEAGGTPGARSAS
jgi:hypothetical protein